MSGIRDIAEHTKKRMEQQNIIRDAYKVSKTIVNHRKRIRAGLEGYDALLKYQNSTTDEIKELYEVQQNASFEALGFDARGGLDSSEITPNVVSEALMSNLYAAFSHVFFVIEGLSYAIENKNLQVKSIPYHPKDLTGEDAYPLIDFLKDDLNQKSLELIIAKSDLQAKGNKIDFTPIPDHSYREIPHWENYKDIEEPKEAFREYFNDISVDLKRIMEKTTLGRYLSRRREDYKGINQVADILMR